MVRLQDAALDEAEAFKAIPGLHRTRQGSWILPALFVCFEMT